MTTYILDAGGNPIGTYRKNQDPSVPQRLHPVPAVNVEGEPIVDESTGEPVMHQLPLDDPRTIAHLAVPTEDFPLGLVVEGTVLVAPEG